MANSKKRDEQLSKGAGSAVVSSALSSAAGGDVPGSGSLLPAFADACALVQAPYSCLVLDTHRRHVALPPMFMRKKRTGIQEELNAELLKYSSSLKGVPMAYDHIKILGQEGDIFNDHGFIHLNIEASFVIFKPKKGEKLVGVINKMAVGHVGCLVHGCFNACVMKPAQLSPEQWRDSGLKVGDSLEFEVFQLDADVAGVLLIKGRLEKSRVQKLVASVSGTETGEKSNAGEESATEPDSAALEGGSESNSASKPKKKKKKRSKEMDMEAVEGNSFQTVEAYDVNSNGTEVNPDSDSHSKEKKKKKKKDKRQKADEELPSPTDLRNSDSSGYLSDKGSRKRKAQDSEGLHDDSDKKKKKKK